MAVEHPLGWLQLDKGRHTLSFICSGRDGRSAGYHLGINDLVLERIPQAAPEEPDAIGPRVGRVGNEPVYRGRSLTEYRQKMTGATGRAAALRGIGAFGEDAGPAAPEVSRMSPMPMLRFGSRQPGRSPKWDRREPSGTPIGEIPGGSRSASALDRGGGAAFVGPESGGCRACLDSSPDRCRARRCAPPRTHSNIRQAAKSAVQALAKGYWSWRSNLRVAQRRDGVGRDRSGCGERVAGVAGSAEAEPGHRDGGGSDSQDQRAAGAFVVVAARY